mgnify:CR=1 FL=1
MAVCQIDTPRLLRPVRVGPDGWRYGEPYQVYTTLEMLSPTEGKLIGLDKPLTRDEWMAMLEAADAEGIERVTFERIVARGARAGAKRMKTLDVKRTIELLKRDGRTERHEVEG